MTILTFDIETIPDVVSGRSLYELGDLSDQETAKAMFALRHAKTGSEFLPHYLQKVVAISLVLQSPTQLKVWTLGHEEAKEDELIQRFFNGIDKHMPTLVSWNGSGFDLPVLHYRALLHGIEAATYWETGDHQQPFRWNNYLNRFHYRHLDLMDILAAYQNRAFAPLDDIATLLGFPGKMGMSGAKVWEAYQNGELASIRHYCETDALNTYCVYLRFERMRGVLSHADYEQSISRLCHYLENEHDKLHLQAFLQKLQAHHT